MEIVFLKQAAIWSFFCYLEDVLYVCQLRSKRELQKVKIPILLLIFLSGDSMPAVMLLKTWLNRKFIIVQ